MYQCIRLYRRTRSNDNFCKIDYDPQTWFTLQGKEYKLWKQSVPISIVGVSTAYLSFIEENNGNALFFLKHSNTRMLYNRIQTLEHNQPGLEISGQF